MITTRKPGYLGFLGLAAALVLGACGDDGGGLADASITPDGAGTPDADDMAPDAGPMPDAMEVVDPCEESEGTIEWIQANIFGVHCRSCHATGDLNLSSVAMSQASLINKPAQHVQAPDGISRVEPGDPMNSFLLHKLGVYGQVVGARMPQGQPMLCAGKLQAIEAWINSLD